MQIRNWYGNGLSAGNLTTSSAGPGDDTFSALSGSSAPAVIEVLDGASVIRVNESAGASNFRWDLAADENDLSVAFRYRINAQPSGSCAILQVLDSTPTQIIRLEQGSTGNLTLRNTANTSIATAGGGTLQVDTWYYITATIIADNGGVEVNVYLEDSVTPLATLSGLAGTSNDARRTTFGSVASVTSSGRYFSDICVADNAVEITQPTNAMSPVRVVSATTYTAVGGGDLVAVVTDASDSTYAESTADPSAEEIVYRLTPAARTAPVTVVDRGAASDSDVSISRTLEIIQAPSTVLATDTYALTTTPTDNSLVTPADVDERTIVYVRITDTVV